MWRGIAVAVLATASIARADSGSEPDVSEQTSAIVGGSTVRPGQWPDAVAVLGTDGYCSGTLIAPDVVLTAGHCAKIGPLQVIANTVDFSKSGGVRANVASTKAYTSWQTSYDVAVVMLASPIKGITPRKVGTPCTFDGFARNTPVRLVGFGATNSLGTQTNTVLKQATAEVTDPDCTGGHGCKHEIAPGGEFVAGGTGQADSCFGDSGGPVYLDTPGGPVVIGAVSRGVEGATTPCGSGGIYVRTDKLIAWLAETTGTVIEGDSCDTPYDTGGDDEVGDDDAGSSIGCSSAGGGGLGVIVLVLLAVCRKRVGPAAGVCRSDARV